VSECVYTFGVCERDSLHALGPSTVATHNIWLEEAVDQS
jgi:hypothetical protein